MKREGNNEQNIKREGYLVEGAALAGDEVIDALFLGHAQVVTVLVLPQVEADDGAAKRLGQVARC